MLLSIFKSDNIWLSLLSLLIAFPALLFSLSAHEFAHGYAAFKQGDGYAKSMGRLTLNPFKHIDPFGTLMMLLVGFGWAKPVPINPYHFRNGKKSMIIVSVAGVCANFILAILSIFFLALFCKIFEIIPIPSVGKILILNNNETIKLIGIVIYNIFSNLAIINICLAVFNLIPIPPLDGYKIFKEFFIGKISYNFFDNVERYSNFILIIFLIISYNSNFIGIISNGIMDFFFELFMKIFI